MLKSPEDENHCLLSVELTRSLSKLFQFVVSSQAFKKKDHYLDKR